MKDFQNFKFLTFATQLILRINFWLSCVVMYIVCGGAIKTWNYKKTIVIAIIMLVPKKTHKDTNNMSFILSPLPFEKVLL